MKRIFRTILGAAMLLSASTMTALAQEPSEGPLWMRYSAISPDGSTIAFAYKGDIFTVPVTGGQARQITSNAAFDSRPVWSPTAAASHLPPTGWAAPMSSLSPGTVESRCA